MVQVRTRIVMTNSSERQQTWWREERRVSTYSQECCITGGFGVFCRFSVQCHHVCCYLRKIKDMNFSSHIEGAVISSAEFHPLSTVGLVAGNKVLCCNSVNFLLSYNCFLFRAM